VALILAAADKKHPGVFSSAELPRLLAWGAAMLFAVGITWFINQHYARTRVEPQIAALERLRNGLLSKNP
jgi:hypothetical protein